MTSEKLITVFNKNFAPGQRVKVEIPKVHVGELKKPAVINSKGEAVVYVSGIVGPVSLRHVRPMGRREEL